MDAAVAAIASWTFLEECPIPQDVPALLVPEERAVTARLEHGRDGAGA